MTREENDFWDKLTITPKELAYMYHAVGLDDSSPKRGVFHMYRNYFLCNKPDLTWEGLCEKCLAVRIPIDGITYRVSSTGIELLERLTLCKFKEH